MSDNNPIDTKPVIWCGGQSFTVAQALEAGLLVKTADGYAVVPPGKTEFTIVAKNKRGKL